METLLSLTSKRAGDWFKEELRLLSGLDHIVDKGRCMGWVLCLCLSKKVGGLFSVLVYMCKNCFPRSSVTSVDFDVAARMRNSSVFFCVALPQLKSVCRT